jgi:hypothetical protein
MQNIAKVYSRKVPLKMSLCRLSLCLISCLIETGAFCRGSLNAISWKVWVLPFEICKRTRYGNGTTFEDPCQNIAIDEIWKSHISPEERRWVSSVYMHLVEQNTFNHLSQIQKEVRGIKKLKSIRYSDESTKVYIAKNEYDPRNFFRLSQSQEKYMIICSKLWAFLWYAFHTEVGRGIGR